MRNDVLITKPLRERKGSEKLTAQQEERKFALARRLAQKEEMMEDFLLLGRHLPEEPWLRDGKVTLRIYHVAKVVKVVGLPLYHLGVEVYGCEHFFSANGVRWCEPGGYESPQHKAITLGTTRMDALEVWQVIDALQPDWHGSTYHLLHKNCQTFASVFMAQVVPGATIPAQYCRFK